MMTLVSDSMLNADPQDARNMPSATRSVAVVSRGGRYITDSEDKATLAVEVRPVRPGASFSHRLSDSDSNVVRLLRPQDAGALLLEPEPRPRSVPRPTARWNVIREVSAGWEDLKDDWDGDDAVAPLKAQTDAVAAFIGAAEARGLREPRSYIAPDGEIGFHWDGSAKASVSFLPVRFLAFCPRADGEPVRVAGPLDIAACSDELFRALAAVR